MKKAFTLVEMIAVLAVLSIIILIIFPVMQDVLFDFEEKSNTQVYEQLYKSSKVYYAEEKKNFDAVAMNSFWISYTPLPTPLYEKTWTETNYPGSVYAWACVDADTLLNKGYLKRKVLEDAAERLDITTVGDSFELAVIMIGKPKNEGTDIDPIYNYRLITIKDGALVKNKCDMI